MDQGVVYVAPVAPHPDDTAIALLALREHERHPVVKDSVQYLERIAPSLAAPWSLAWATLALAAYGRPIDTIYNSLVACVSLSNIEDTSTLVLVCLAIDPQRALLALGVTS